MSFEATSRIRDPIYGCAGIITRPYQIIQVSRRPKSEQKTPPKFHNPDIRPVPNPLISTTDPVSSPSRRPSILAVHGRWFRRRLRKSTWLCSQWILSNPDAGPRVLPHSIRRISQRLQSILKTDGPAGLYRGIAAIGLSASPAHAVYFLQSEFCKKAFSGRNRNNHLARGVRRVRDSNKRRYFHAYGYPGEQRLQLSGGGVGAYRGVWDCVKEAKRTLMEISPDSASDERLIVHATAGAAAGALASVVTTPLDVVKTHCSASLVYDLQLVELLERKNRKLYHCEEDTGS
ncbi:hypothetical protein Nepgr_010868 [Nepenthes gracilis]|uniref:Mitochondrial carrier protein n=1 Tax=Nepenthes gracilis TaxID=150966 RepID=A0AAD3XLF2_NEPGR|nr:hypothetical protein Nepgr_010868 [Nepenthes gracilis]